MHHFPEDRRQRRILVVVDRLTMGRAYYEPDLLEFAEMMHREPGVTIVGYPLPRALRGNKILQKLEDSLLLRPGYLLVLSPFNDEYYPVEEGTDIAIAFDKIRSFARLCQILGAREVKVEQAIGEHNEEAKKSRVSLESGVKVRSIDAGVQGNIAREARRRALYEQMLRFHEVYAGAQPDIARAKTFLVESGLHTDLAARSLVESVADQSNPVRSRRYEIEIFREAEASLKWAVDVGARLRGLVSLNVDVSVANEKEQKNSMRATFAVMVRFE